MLQTIEVEIDAKGVIHPLEPLPKQGNMRGLLTILGNVESESVTPEQSDENIESLFGVFKSDQGVGFNKMEVAAFSEDINPLKDSVIFEGDLVSPTDRSWMADQ